MKKLKDLSFGFGDAESYRQKDHKEFFNQVFVKNQFLDKLMLSCVYFLIGEKGTGKTAYSVFLSNNNYKETSATIKFLRDTDYLKFLHLKDTEQLQLSDYASIWKTILLIMVAKTIDESHIVKSFFGKDSQLLRLQHAIDNYYEQAFTPEIDTVLEIVKDAKAFLEMQAGPAKVGGEIGSSRNEKTRGFQINLLKVQKLAEEALRPVKLAKNVVIFVDGIDIRPDNITYSSYIECIKGLGNAVWSLNNDLFATIKDSPGRLRIVLLMRPDIFTSIGFSNATNKIRDNAVFLDWRTTYPAYRSSHIFAIADKLLSAQQPTEHKLGEAWDSYFPWQAPATSPDRESDPPFIDFLRISYSRPRDIVTALQLLHEETVRKNSEAETFLKSVAKGDDFKTAFSEYLIGAIKDQLAFYYSESDFEVFLSFFTYLKGQQDFSYDQYIEAFSKFVNNAEASCCVPAFAETPEKFLQFLYDTNIICYIEDTDIEPLFRWCYRERSPSIICPKVKINMRYRIHYGLHKALNVGSARYVATK